MDDLEIWRAAQATIDQYGDETALHAAQRADELLAAGDFGCHATMLRYDDSHNGVRCRKLPTASNLKDGKMGFLLFLAVVALGAIVWLLFRIDALSFYSRSTP